MAALRHEMALLLVVEPAARAEKGDAAAARN
jgi:hypothetical protein